MTLVHLRVLDSKSNLPIAFRLRMIHANGSQACPLGRQLRFPLSANIGVGGQALLDGQVYHWIDGACEVMLEPGKYWVEVTRGNRYTPLARWVEVKPGQAALRLLLDPEPGPWPGWMIGDARCHGLSAAAAGLEGAANGMDLVHLLAREYQPNPDAPADISSLLQYSGQGAALTHDCCEVFVNTLNTNPILGSISILNSHRPVFPLASCTPESPELWSILDWSRQGHRKGGLVSWVNGTAGVPQLQGEALAAAILGELDTFEISNPLLSRHSQVQFWYLILNAGIRLPILGSSGKESNTQEIGSLFTACRILEGESGQKQWIEAARTGQSFVSSGPFLHAYRSGGKEEFACHYSCQMEGLELQWVLNGDVVHVQPSGRGERNCVFSPPPGAMGWLAVRLVDLSRDEFAAHSNPLDLGGYIPLKRKEALDELSKRLRETSMVLSQGEYHPLKFRDQILSSLEKAQKRLIMES